MTRSTTFGSEKEEIASNTVGGRGSLFFFQAEDGIRDLTVTGVQTCALPISRLARTLRAAPGGYGVHTGAFLARHLRACVSGRTPRRAAAAALPPGSRWSGRGPVILPAPVADARFLAVPDGVDGPGSHDGDLPGALHALPGASRAGEALGSEGVGLPRRRLERHQGAVGLALGSAAGARPSGPAAPGDGGVRRRRVPELQGQGRGLHA